MAESLELGAKQECYSLQQAQHTYRAALLEHLRQHRRLDEQSLQVDTRPQLLPCCGSLCLLGVVLGAVHQLLSPASLGNTFRAGVLCHTIIRINYAKLKYSGRFKLQVAVRLFDLYKRNAADEDAKTVLNELMLVTGKCCQ